MKHISKLLVLVLALVMVLSVFAGCTPADPTNPQTDPQTDTQPNNKETNPPEDDSIFPLAEKKTYNIGVIGNPDWDTMKEKNLWYQELVKRTNVEINFVGLGATSADAGSNLSAQFNADTHPHAYIGNVLTSAQVVEAAAGGFLLPLEDYLTEEVMPGYVGRGIAEVPGVPQAATTTDGHIYTLPRINIDGYGNVETVLAVNTEWVKAAGLDDVSTLEKFEQYLKYVKENDMNGNGDPNDEIPFLTAGTTAIEQGAIQGIMAWWGLPTKDSDNDYYTVITNGEVELAPQTDAYRAALIKINEWYEAGYLWSELYTGDKNGIKTAISGVEVPIVGAMNTSARAIDLKLYGDGNGDTTNDGVMKRVNPPAVEGYTARLFINPAQNGYKDCYAITNKCTAEDAQIILAWMDMAMFTLEGSINSGDGYEDGENVMAGLPDAWDWDDTTELGFVRYALSVEDYNKQMDMESTMASVTGSFCYCYVPSDYDKTEGGWRNLSAQYKEIKDLGTEYNNTEIWPRPYMTEDQADEVSFLWPDVKAVITEYETKFVKGELEINDANWQAYMKALYKADIDTLVDILQEAYDASQGK